ncbi:MAG: SBBP repeat-containing protein [Bacteroidota bacterium]
MKKLLFFFIFTVSTVMVMAQSVPMIFQDWTTNAGTQNYFYKNKMKTDASGNTYLVGATLNASGNYDILVSKVNGKGALQWKNQYDGGYGDDIGTAIYIDANGNVFITGTTKTANSVDIISIRYNSSGTQKWLNTYNGPASGGDAGMDLTGDASGRTYVTGYVTDTSSFSNLITICYNFTGAFQWATQYNYTTNLNDAGVRITLNGTTATATGCTQTNTTTFKYCTVNFNTTSGAITSSSVGSTNNNTGINQVNDMVQDASGNIYIAGSVYNGTQNNNFDVVKLNSSLNISWERTYNTADSLDDIANAIEVDSAGNVYVSGYVTTTTQGKNIKTLKYNSSGTLQWEMSYNDSLNGNDEAKGMALDAYGNVYVTGYTSTDIDQANYITIKYNPSGSEIWKIQTDGSAHLNDKAFNVSANNTGVVVAGQSETSSGTYEYLTVKYLEKQIIVPTDYNGEEPQNSFGYYENRGQLIKTNDSLAPEIKYYTNNSSPAFFIKDYSHSFVFAKVDTSASTADTLQRIDVNFSKCNPDARTFSLNERTDYLNYFLGHCPKGITQVRANNRLVTTDLYANIDLIYSSNQNGIKYYYVIKPGGNPANINLEFTGATSFNLNGSTNELTINGNIGSIKFKRPTVYQLNSSNQIIQITGWTADWQTNGASNLYKFNIGAYDNTKALVIQVDGGQNTQTLTTNGNLEWSTYIGGSEDDYIYDVTNDNSGNVYATGLAWSTVFPISGTTYGTNLGTGTAFVLAFHPYGTPIWSTYYGGNGGDGGLSITADTKGNVFFTGYTSANTGFTTNSFPVQHTANEYYHEPIAGPDYAFVVRLNQVDGNRTWATVYGDDNGAARFIGWTIDHDVDNNIYIGGKGERISNFPLAGGGYPFCLVHQQTDYNHSMGFIAQFDNTTYDLVWSTLFGNDGTVVKDIALTTNKDLFITGFTSGTNTSMFNMENENNWHYSHSFNGGSFDAFIAKFNFCHEIKWGTFFGGTDSDYGNGICLSNGYVLITGTTSSDSGSFPIVDNNNSNSLNRVVKGNNSEGFIASFATDGNIQWSTYFGGNGTDECNKICANANGNIFVTGKTNSASKDEPLTSFTNGYIQTDLENVNPAGIHSDAFVLGFNNNKDFLWSTYFGGEVYGGGVSDDIGWGISAFGQNKLYIAGQTRSFVEFPVFVDHNNYPLAYYQDQNAAVNGYNDGFIAQFGLNNTSLPVNEIMKQNDNLFVYPNPNDGNFTISANNVSDNSLVIDIYNSIGQLIYSKEVLIRNRTLLEKIKIDDLSKGIYFIKLSGFNEMNLKKIIIF